MPLIGVLIPGEAISCKQKRREPGGGGSFPCVPGHLGELLRIQEERLSEDQGQRFDITESKLKIHINLERISDDKEKSIFTVKLKSWATDTKGAGSALQTLGNL